MIQHCRIRNRCSSIYNTLPIQPVLTKNKWFLDATCGFYIQLKIKSFIQNAGSGVLAEAAQTSEASHALA